MPVINGRYEIRPPLCMDVSLIFSSSNGCWFTFSDVKIILKSCVVEWLNQVIKWIFFLEGPQKIAWSSLWDLDWVGATSKSRRFNNWSRRYWIITRYERPTGLHMSTISPGPLFDRPPDARRTVAIGGRDQISFRANAKIPFYGGGFGPHNLIISFKQGLGGGVVKWPKYP